MAQWANQPKLLRAHDAEIFAEVPAFTIRPSIRSLVDPLTLEECETEERPAIERVLGDALKQINKRLKVKSGIHRDEKGNEVGYVSLLIPHDLSDQDKTIVEQHLADEPFARTLRGLLRAAVPGHEQDSGYAM